MPLRLSLRISEATWRYWPWSDVMSSVSRTFIARSLADPEVLPWLAADDQGACAGAQEIELALNASDLTKRQSFAINNTDIRNQVAEILADTAVSFVFLHELGHVLAGHADLPDANGMRPVIAEFSLVELVALEPSEQARAWKYEADVVGAGLMNT